MGRGGKIFLVLLLIVVIVLVVIAHQINLRRYFDLRDPDILKLDNNYCELPLIEGDRTVISFSSIPERLELMKPVIGSLLTQNVRVHEIALNIPYVSRKNIPYIIPSWMSSLKSLTIHRVEKDEGPGTKLLPTLRREGPKTRIIVLDDDNIYNREIVKELVRHYENSDVKYGLKKKAAVTNYGVKLSCKGGLPSILTRGWYFINSEREVDLLQGFSGFLVTPSMFPPQALNISEGPKEAISVDDVWFSGWLRWNGISIVTPGCTYQRMPLLNFGDIRCTPRLAYGENKAFARDLIVIKWFIEEQGVKPVM